MQAVARAAVREYVDRRALRSKVENALDVSHPALCGALGPDQPVTFYLDLEAALLIVERATGAPPLSGGT